MFGSLYSTDVTLRESWTPVATRGRGFSQLTRFTTCLIAAVFGCVPLRALDPQKPAGSYSIKGWFVDDGLPADKIRDVVQTHDGYLWVATSQGVARFDGSRFTRFTGATNPELRGGGFYAVCETPDGALWFGGDNGLFRWNRGRFDRFTTDQGLAHNYVRALAVTRDGTLVACTRTGFSFVRDGKITAPNASWQKATGVTRAFYQSADGTMYLGTDDGLWRATSTTFEKISGGTDLPGNIFSTLLGTSDGSVWVGNSVGLHRISPGGRVEHFSAAEGLVNPRVAALRADAAGNIWIGTYGGGLFRWSNGRVEAANYTKEFAGILIQQLYESREGGLWVATAMGLYRLGDQISSSIGLGQGLEQTTVYSMLESTDGNWWIGLWGGGVYRYDQKRATKLPLPPSTSIDRVISFAEAPDRAMWIGALSGLYRYADGAAVNYFRPDLAKTWLDRLAQDHTALLPGIAHSRVNAIAVEGPDQVWVATDGALYHSDRGAFRAYTTADGLPGNAIKEVIRARNGDIWISVSPEGVARLHDGRWTSYLAGHEIADVAPRALYEDNVGTIWVGTEGGGLNRFKKGNWRTFTAADGLADDFICGLTQDAAGNFWIACPAGVMRIPSAQFDEIDSGKRTLLRPRIVDRADGLAASESNQQGFPSAWRTRDDRILFPTDRGVSVIDPGKIKVGEATPPAYIERLVINSQRVDFSHPLEVMPGSNDIEIGYTGISLRAANKVRFRIQLAPLDRDWIEVGSRRDVHYAKLPPGEYSFHVSAANDEGVWSEPAATIAFKVRPFFYQTVWFAVLAALVVVASVAGIYAVRAQRARRQMAELEALVKARTRELETAKNSADAAVEAKTEVIEALKQAELEHELLHRQLVETSRQAGMAEVATSVLHNVGNVLNSVNVSATLVTERVRDSKIAFVPKIGAMLSSRAQDLAVYLSSDPKGQKIPDYLATLGKDLLSEQQTTIEELGHLRKNIEHIKEIVAMQQNFAKVSGVTESISITELADDALRITSSSLTRHEVELIRDYQAQPKVVIDRHKVMQVLVNLVRNAKSSCDESGLPNKKIILRITQVGERVSLWVIDNGVGISKENLTRIFAHGFTTKKEGHGFGLHSGALAAKELGGTLVAMSDGPGQGASFILELPINHAMNA